jgi:hypothetical protein
MALYTSSVQMSCSPLHDITRKGLRWPGTGPTPRTNHQAEDRATVQAVMSHQEDYMNKSYKARLSILILSKAYPFMVYLAM